MDPAMRKEQRISHTISHGNIISLLWGNNIITDEGFIDFLQNKMCSIAHKAGNYRARVGEHRVVYVHTERIGRVKLTSDVASRNSQT